MKQIIAFLACIIAISACKKNLYEDQSSERVNADAVTYNPAPSLGNRSGMVFESGVFAEHDANLINQFEIGRSAKVDIITVFTGNDRWYDSPDPNSKENAIINGWFMSDNNQPTPQNPNPKPPIPTKFRENGGNLSIAVPLWPKNSSLKESLMDKVAYAKKWKDFGLLVASKYPKAYIRLGWEMNLYNNPNMYWIITPDNAENWKAAFRIAVDALRSVSSQFRIVFNVNEMNYPKYKNLISFNEIDFYPGNNYVDIIGLDAYDWNPAYKDGNINFHQDPERDDLGWDYWLNFAKENNKKFALCEWGVSSGTKEKNPGGDNPLYINFVYDWLSDNREWIQYECYFSEDGYDSRTGEYILLSQILRNDSINKNAGEAYKEWMPKLKNDYKRPVNGFWNKLGVYANSGESIEYFESKTNRQVNVVSVFSSIGTWDKMKGTWYLADSYFPSGSGFKARGGNVMISMPLWPQNYNTLDDVYKSKSAFQFHWKAIGSGINGKFPNAYIRLGWDMNKQDKYWAQNSTNREQWKELFKWAYESLKTTAPNVKIIWNPAVGAYTINDLNRKDFYPGDDVVDIIGISAKDDASQSSIFSESNKLGWYGWFNWAKNNHSSKKFAITEWGVRAKTAGGNGDDPVYIDSAFNFLKKRDIRKNIEFECYHSDVNIGSDLFGSNNYSASNKYKAVLPKLWNTYVWSNGL